MQKIKDFFGKIYGKIAIVVVAIFAILIYIIDKKNREIKTFKVKAQLVKTEEEARKLKNEITTASKERGLLQCERKDINEALNILKQKRKELKKEAENKSDKEIEDFWE